MTREQEWLQRIGLIGSLVEKAPGQTLGRTAIVKLPYLLQVLRGVPLRYDFSLYTYGPFDSDVLEDLSYAGVFGAVTEKIVPHARGYGYEVKPGRRWPELRKQAKDWLDKYEDDIQWVIREFGDSSAAELELVSTIIFADRENAGKGEPVSLERLAREVRQIKPKFSSEYVLAKCREALRKQFLIAIRPSP
jgi:hypothetical protein